MSVPGTTGAKKPEPTAQSGLSYGVLVRHSKQNFLSRIARAGDFGAGKDGTMSAIQADAKYASLISKIVDSKGVPVSAVDEETEAAFQMALYSYLALNTGSTNAEDGFAADFDSETTLQAGDFVLSARLLREEMGSSAYRFMRAKADEIHMVLSEQYRRVSSASSLGDYPRAYEFVRHMDVVAAKRGMAEHPTYAFVGAEYVSGLSPKLRKVVAEATALVLGNRTHTRDDARDGVMRAVATYTR